MDYTMSVNEGYVEAIKEGEIVKVPESVALEEDLFVLRRIDSSDSVQSVPAPVEKVSKKSSFDLNEWRSGRTISKVNNVVRDLVDNFHWEIAKGRRMKNLSRGKLASEIGTDEETMKMIELGELPSDDFVLINRIEQVLGINLRKEKLVESVTLKDLQKMNENRVRGEIDKIQKIDRNSSPEISGDDVEILELD